MIREGWRSGWWGREGCGACFCCISSGNEEMEAQRAFPRLKFLRGVEWGIIFRDVERYQVVRFSAARCMDRSALSSWSGAVRLKRIMF